MPSAILRLIARQWFLVGLAAVLVIGFVFWAQLRWIASPAWLRNSIVAVVLFLMAWPLQSSAMWRAVRRPGAALLAFGMNFGLLPLTAWAFMPLLQGELALGLVVAAAAPCTLASAAVWTRQAGGNDAVALIVTISTNLACFLLTPFWLFATTGQGEVELPVGQMVSRLGLLVVLPIVAGQLSRLHRPVADWTTRRKTTLSTLSQCGILSIVLIGAIQSAARLAEIEPGQGPGFAEFAWMIVAVAVVHTLVLGAGHLASAMVGLGRSERIAVGFAGSQKTLMVGIYIATTYFGGLTILPMVAYHVVQLVIDAVVADRLKASGDSRVLDSD